MIIGKRDASKQGAKKRILLNGKNADILGSMRFSTLQENGYGVGFTENQHLNDVDVNTMATSDVTQPGSGNPVEESSMVSNLPLLFANGYPTSLEKITLVQLERFITFMVQCSLGHDTTEVITEPQWWPKEVRFSNPLMRPKKINENWMANLKKLVFRCYTYHRSEYLLRFCSYLARYPHEELEYVNNWDSTTSLYHKSTGKLLVTFRNENMNYDKRTESARKSLLSHNGVTSSYSTKSKQQQHSLIMVEPPCEDIYLCDNCDAEFIGVEKMKDHERICCEHEQSNGNSRPATPEVSSIGPEMEQHKYLEYFQLYSRKPESKLPEVDNRAATNDKAVRRSSRRVRGSINFARCSTIPFSSPAGIVLAKKSKAMTEETQQERLERIERHVVAPVLNDSCRPKWLDGEIDHDRWIITHKSNRDKPIDDYVHRYRFIKSVKGKPMLSIRSQLLYVVCRPVYVFLTRLSQEQIDELRRDPTKYRCPIRRISIHKNGPTSRRRSKSRIGLSSKRKAPEEDSELVVEEEEREGAGGHGMPVIDAAVTSTTTPTDATAAATPTGALTAFNTVTIAKPLKDGTTQQKSGNGVAVINLCSSDEEEDSSVPASSDENRDPMNTDVDIRKSLLRKLTPNKLCAKPCIYPADTTDWLSDNILNDDDESYANKLRSNVMLNTHLSPILRPAP
ncbi:hypothetical protein KM043_000879 [Ampulex compressa]|nr:hypothetical protein KM043_000879 [Ampulex compressa]